MQIDASKWISYPIISRHQRFTLIVTKLLGKLFQVSDYGLLNINFFVINIVC